jgi:hypothetical protein
MAIGGAAEWRRGAGVKNHQYRGKEKAAGPKSPRYGGEEKGRGRGKGRSKGRVIATVNGYYLLDMIRMRRMEVEGFEGVGPGGSGKTGIEVVW